MLRIVNVPPRGIGLKTVRTLEGAAQAHGSSIYEQILDPPEDLGTRARNALSSFAEMVEGWISVHEALTVAQLIDRILEDTRYADYIRDGTDEGEDRWANVLELRNVSVDYVGVTLFDFLTEVALVSDVDNLSDDVDAPTLLTLHSAKGLEFPVVFIVGLEEGILPHSRSLDDAEQLAEERRLMYVGLTRAKDRLYLSYAFTRNRYGDNEPTMPSSFLEDIPSRLKTGDWQATPRKRSRRTAWSQPRPAVSQEPEQATFHAGQRVRHRAFGEGLVIESRVVRGDEIVTVAFQQGDLKRLLAGIAPLEAVAD
jgi:DNA helicase-2/ATP-dependent DNA helicase PcrA